jgi:hypothetical protein
MVARMKNACKTSLLIIILLSVFLIPTCTQAQTEKLFFSDNFNGNTIDTNKWDVALNGGSLNVENNFVELSSEGSSFPSVYAKGSHIPASGDFAIEFTMQYSSFGLLGTGFWVTQGKFESHDGDPAANILEVWGDTQKGAIVGSAMIGQPVWYANASNLFYSYTFRLQYSNNTYTLYINGAQICSAYSDLRADSIGFGNPNLSPQIPGHWTSIKVNSINIYGTSSNPANPATLIITIAGIIVAATILTLLGLLLYRSIKKSGKFLKKNTHRLNQNKVIIRLNFMEVLRQK